MYAYNIMNTTLLSYLLLIGLSTIGIYHNSVSFNPLRFHCNNYILSTYLYFILGWAISLATMSTIDEKQISLGKLFTTKYTILLSIISILLIISLSIIPASWFVLKHFIFILELIMIGVSLFPLYKIYKDRFNHVGLTTLLIILILSLIAFYRPTILSDNIGSSLLIGLLTIIIARLIEYSLFDYNNYKKSPYSRFINYATIVLFSLYIIHDTKSIIRNSRTCSMSPYGPDFIIESIQLFLDSLNIFSSNLSLRSE